MPLYAAGVEAFGRAEINWPSDDVLVLLIDTAYYTVNLDTHDTLADIPSGARVASAALTGKTVSGRVFDASDVSINGVTGDSAEAILIALNTGVEATSTLIFYTDSGTGLPTLSFSNETANIAWSNASNKIFSIG
jgi:hypothetical protein